MSVLIITYRDLKAEAMHGYEFSEIQADGMVLREGIFPGAFGFPDMHVAHLTLTYAGRRTLIICQTDYELTPAKGIEVLAGALKLLEDRTKN